MKQPWGRSFTQQISYLHSDLTWPAACWALNSNVAVVVNVGIVIAVVVLIVVVVNVVVVVIINVVVVFVVVVVVDATSTRKPDFCSYLVEVWGAQLSPASFGSFHATQFKTVSDFLLGIKFPLNRRIAPFFFFARFLIFLRFVFLKIQNCNFVFPTSVVDQKVSAKNLTILACAWVCVWVCVSVCVQVGVRECVQVGEKKREREWW